MLRPDARQRLQADPELIRLKIFWRFSGILNGWNPSVRSGHASKYG
jgi:hypothetical protein